MKSDSYGMVLDEGEGRRPFSFVLIDAEGERFSASALVQDTDAE
jgi:hypothetical protein